MTDTHEAVRLADFAMRMQTRLGSCRESCNDYDKMAWDDYDAMAALLRRIPELEAERDQLRAWQQAAFAAYPNIDLDIDALTPPHTNQKGAA